jgi:hypothetical protein
MRRLYFLSPDVDSTRALCRDLEGAGVPHHHIHVVADESIPLGDLPRASAFDKTELGHGLEWGLGLGGTAGMLGGLLAVTFPPAGLVLGGGALLASTAAGAGFGALVSSLVAKDVTNHELEAFEAAVDQGELLVLVDVPKAQVDAMQELIRNTHPEAEIGISSPPSSSRQHEG